MEKKMPKEVISFLERSLNWILPGCQLFYRDTDSDIDVRKSYPVGAIIRAGTFVDVTVKVQRPVTKVRYLIASAHCARLYEAVPDEDMARWRLCTLHFNSYFKVMDVYERGGVTQIFLLHIPYQAIPFFQADHSFDFIQGASQINLVEVARKSLDTKLAMDVFADTTEPELLASMAAPVGVDDEGNPLSLDFVPTPDFAKDLSDAVRRLGDDLYPINYPEGYSD